MMSILNALRAAPQQITAPSPTATGTHPGWTTPVMPALTDPGTTDARVNLLFREKAFWTFSRGQRLGDLRRLIRDYGRAADGSNAGGYPIGTHYKGGVYGVDLNCRSRPTSRSGTRTSPAASIARPEQRADRSVQEREADFRLPFLVSSLETARNHRVGSGIGLRGMQGASTSTCLNGRQIGRRTLGLSESEPIGTLT